MTKPDHEVSVVVLAGSNLELEAVQRHLTDVEPVMPLSWPARASLSVGRIRGTAVHIAFGRLGPGRTPEPVDADAIEAAKFLHPTAVLVVSLADALRDEVAVGDVVVATRLDHHEGQDSPEFGSRITTWHSDTALQARATGVAHSAWWSADQDVPCDVHFSVAATVRDATTLTRPVTHDFGDAVVIGSERLLPASRDEGRGLPMLFIYGVGARGNRGLDVLALRQQSSALGNLAVFTVALALELDGNDLVRRLRSMGHGDRVARTDLLARHAFVESLAELLSYSAPTEDEQDLAGPTVIAIEGAWGAGKSTLMSMTRARLDAIRLVGKPIRHRWWHRLVARVRRRKLRAWEADFALNGWFTGSTRWHEAGRSPVLTALFNPWSYLTGEHVWAGLNECIVSAVITGDVETVKRFWFVHNAERLDRRHIQRTLRKRILSPVLRLAVFALPVPLLVQLLRTTTPYTVLGHRIEPVDLALWAVGVLLAIGLVHTAVRYFFRRADTLLPAELFGPSGALGSAGAGTDDPLRDPHRRARTGLLHGMQQDVHSLLEGLGADGRQLVVFIDDLDRCSPRTTADVFEAINGFLTDSFPTIRFVLGIDAAAAAAHLDAAYSALSVAGAGRDAADPSAGWTFLRKLVQLPLPLPRVVQAHVEPLLLGLLGAPRTTVAEAPDELAATPDAERPAPRTPATEAEPAERRVIRTARTVVALEHDELVQARFAERLRAQPDLSVREAKRILTVWMFYVRVLDRLSPEAGSAAVHRACHLVLLAEIVARWPASQRCLHRRIDGTHGLRALAAALDDHVQWENQVHRFGLAGDRHRSFRGGVREILQEYDGEEIAKLAEQLT